MKQSLMTALVVTLLMAVAGASYADTINGKIKDINTDGNSLTLMSDASETVPAAEHKLVWEANLPDAERLKTAHVGEFLSVDAEQNPITRNWKVTMVRGPLAKVENAISSTEREISGEIQNLDLNDNSLVLATTEADVSGKRTEYHVVWDNSNKAVRERMEKAKLGDKITVMADQNKITRNWKANSIVGPVKDMIHADVKTISGEIKSLDPAENSLVLSTKDESGKTVDRKIVWDENFKEEAKLENMHIGDRLSVRANQNIATRNWKVQALGT